MASNPYEVEHNIKDAPKPHRRRPDMTSFTSALREANDPHSPQHLGATPVAIGNVFQLVHDQLATIFQDSSSADAAPDDSPDHARLLEFHESMLRDLRLDIDAPPREIQGVTQEYLDTRCERIPRKSLKPDDACPICTEKHLDDPYCLVVELECKGAHRFDLECIGPWLQSKGTCPMCRQDLTKKKVVEVPKDDEDEDEDDMDGLYG
ncbi:hypothetical protein F5Y15DRAFT_372239 [Xylariaceae sp. FL0016]|nr:hypothetical protein F5Y15DRAFT_372239 [Xylariaceae sp. FL0016]